jgi:hypothetical protein
MAHVGTPDRHVECIHDPLTTSGSAPKSRDAADVSGVLHSVGANAISVSSSESAARPVHSPDLEAVFARLIEFDGGFTFAARG